MRFQASNSFALCHFRSFISWYFPVIFCRWIYNTCVNNYFRFKSIFWDTVECIMTYCHSPTIFSSDWVLQMWSMRKCRVYLEGYINNKHIWLKNNTAQLHFILGSADLCWNFSRFPSGSSIVLRTYVNVQ